MAYYQVNQRDTFDQEFSGHYLCCPAAGYGGWPLMRELRAGDIVFHYSSKYQAVLGISRIVAIGEHKGKSKSHSVIEGTQCIRYDGRHLSEAAFDQTRRDKLRNNYPAYYEVHTEQIVPRKLSRLLTRTPQAYLVPIDDELAQQFLVKNQVTL